MTKEQVSIATRRIRNQREADALVPADGRLFLYFGSSTLGPIRMNVHIASRRCKQQTLEQRYPNAEIINVTSKAAERDLLLLDYETNADVYDLSKPLSHASLVVRYLKGDWPA